MIPYFKSPSFDVGFTEIHGFGILVATGLIIGLEICQRRAKKMGLDPAMVFQFGIIAFVSGFIIAHQFHIFLYHPEEFRADPMSVFYIWSGISSFGGFTGGVIAGIIYFKIKKVSVWAYGDVMVYGFAPGWFFGRCGCFTAHDHRGNMTDFFLAVDFPEGARHDLGLYEALLMLGLTIVFFIWGRKPRFPGFFMSIMCVVYGLARFGFDFLRASDLSYVDSRYFGLTPAQYGSLFLVGLGIFIFLLQRNKPPHVVENPAPSKA